MQGEKMPENVISGEAEAKNTGSNEDSEMALRNEAPRLVSSGSAEARRFVYRETLIVGIGVAAASALMIAVFAMLGRFDRSVLLGGVIGTLVAVANFFFMAVSASLAADKAQGQDVKGGAALMKGSYAIRLIVMFLILLGCVKSGLCNVLAIVLPMVFVRPVITIAEFFRKSGEA